MTIDAKTLSDREKAALRLLAHGHDAKSTARALGTSVHAINERLRSARRKLHVSSSREAARLLASVEQKNDNLLVAEKIGIAAASRESELQSHHAKSGKRSLALVAGGICIVSLVIISAMLAVTSSQTNASGPLPNWRLEATAPTKLSQQANRIYLSGNRLLWNGEEASEESVRRFLAVETQMSPQPLTILSHGSQVTPGRLQRTRQLMDRILNCKAATCLEVTPPVDEDGAAQQPKR